MTTFIHLPAKSTEGFDWNSCLTNFLDSTFGKSFTTELTPSINQLNKLRTDIQHSNLKDAETIVPSYLNYTRQLQSIGLRLPMGMILSSNEMEFEWSDAFDSKKGDAIKQKSLSYEKASILFNLSAVYSYLGATSSSSMEWKSAITYYTNASGVLEYISQHFLHSPSNDLKVDTAKGFAKLMLAQAQECFLWNYMQSSPAVKHSLAARLAEGTHSSYQTAYNFINKSNITLDCKDEIHFKSIYFHTFALFHYAQSYVDLSQIGYALAVNKLALESFYEGRRLSGQSKGKVEAGLLQLHNDLEKEVTAKSVEWEKDNDLIYHQAIPDKTNVPTIKAMDGAKPLNFEELLNKSGNRDLFEKIVPMEAHQGMSIYSEKQAQILRKYSEKIQIANEQVKSLFEFSKLPSSVVEIQNILREPNAVIDEEEREKENDYPKVLAMSHEMESSVTYDFPRDMEFVAKKRAMILKQLENAEEIIAKDERNMLVKGLSESPQLNHLKDSLSNTHKILGDAGSSDSRLTSMWDKCKDEIAIMQRGTTGVQSWLSKSVHSDPSEDLTQKVSLLDLDDVPNTEEMDTKNAQHLVDCVYSAKKSLELLMAERNSTLNDLKDVMHNEDISSVLIKYSGASEEELEGVFNEQLSKYDSYVSRLDGLIAAQDDKIVDLKDSLNSLLDSSIVKKKVAEKKKQRGTIKAKLATLIKAYETWKLCMKGTSEALSFYTKLLEKTVDSVNKVNDIVNHRNRAFNDTRSSISSVTSGGFGGYTMNIPQYQQQYQQPQQPSGNSVPMYYPSSRTGSIATDPSSGPPLPAKPSTSNQPYTTPSVYDPNMYSQFGQNWK